jgi:hypothetical protein
VRTNELTIERTIELLKEIEMSKLSNLQKMLEQTRGRKLKRDDEVARQILDGACHRLRAKASSRL